MAKRTRRTKSAVRSGVALVALLMLIVSPFIPDTGGASASVAASAATKSVTATRTNVVDGETVTKTNKISVSVDRTTNLRDQQSVHVTWKGAVPSSNVASDPNSSIADFTEYPMVLLECRDADPKNASVDDRVTPDRCWAVLSQERLLTTYDAAEGSVDHVGSFPAWRLDRYATAADRAQFAGVPEPHTSTCPSSGALAQHSLPFISASGSKYYGSGSFTGCGPTPPEAASFSGSDASSSLPDNATFAATPADGRGSFDFNVRDAQTNASLGCSSSVACSLVAVPIVGISCDPTLFNDPDEPEAADNAAAQCAAGAHYPVGSLSNSGGVDNNPTLSVTGKLWWSESNWRNRVVFPLTFAPPSNVCDLVSKKTPVDVYGSELVISATTQWQAKLCLDGTQTPFKHIRTPEPLARRLVQSGSIEAAFSSDPPDTPFTTPTVQAPIAATGFAVSYSIDDSNQQPYTKLRLTPRLLAKLMTESYSVYDLVQSKYTYTDASGAKSDPLKNNPINITQDPEFIALNPGITKYSGDGFGLASMILLGSQSDVMKALTAYINADPEARAWLDGVPDPWGMRVNPNYQGISLPVDTWPLLDQWTFPKGVITDSSDCRSVDSQPAFLPLVAGPLTRLPDITQAVQYARPGDSHACSSKFNPLTQENYSTYTRAPRQSFGYRFVIGVTSLGDAQAYSLNTAALESQSTASTTSTFHDGSGRTFVAPTDASLRRTFDMAEFDPKSFTWPIDYSAMRTSSAGQQAYPGGMFVYADIPTQGLPRADAQAYGAMLDYLSGAGQTPGDGVGQLPPGFLPITKSNGLGDLASYSARAATAVKAQQGDVPPLHAPPVTSSPATSPHTHRSTPTPTRSRTHEVRPVVVPPAPSSSTSKSTASSTPPAATSPAPSPSSPPVVLLGKTVSGSSSGARVALVGALLLLACGPLTALASAVSRRRGARR